jgi:hypothetical protein
MTPTVKQDNITQLWDGLSTLYILLLIILIGSAL